MKYIYHQDNKMMENTALYLLLLLCNVKYQYYIISSLFMTYHRVCDKSNTMGATNEEGTAYPYRAPEFTPSL
jgi:hypothetical protein